MPDTTDLLGIEYLLPSDPPDLSGGLYGLATSLENGPLAQGGWTPSYGGDSGATVGNDAGTDGYVTRLGRRCTYFGRVVFGSSAVFGGAVIGPVQQYGSLNYRFSQGHGHYFNNANSARTPVRLITTDGITFRVLVETAGALAPLSTLGTPAQGSQLFFTIDGVLA